MRNSTLGLSTSLFSLPVFYKEYSSSVCNSNSRQGGGDCIYGLLHSTELFISVVPGTQKLVSRFACSSLLGLYLQPVFCVQQYCLAETAQLFFLRKHLLLAVDSCLSALSKRSCCTSTTSSSSPILSAILSFWT